MVITFLYIFFNSLHITETLSNWRIKKNLIFLWLTYNIYPPKILPTQKFILKKHTHIQTYVRFHINTLTLIKSPCIFIHSVSQSIMLKMYAIVTNKKNWKKLKMQNKNKHLSSPKRKKKNWQEDEGKNNEIFITTPTNTPPSPL